MGIYNKVYIGHVETINPDVNELVSPGESKVVALKLAGFDNINKTFGLNIITRKI